MAVSEAIEAAKSATFLSQLTANKWGARRSERPIVSS